MRAAKQAGTVSVELRPNGTIIISLNSTGDDKTDLVEPEQEVEL
jgi:hypothetical protein